MRIGGKPRKPEEAREVLEGMLDNVESALSIARTWTDPFSEGMALSGHLISARAIIKAKIAETMESK